MRKRASSGPRGIKYWQSRFRQSSYQQSCSQAFLAEFQPKFNYSSIRQQPIMGIDMKINQIAELFSDKQADIHHTLQTFVLAFGTRLALKTVALAQRQACSPIHIRTAFEQLKGISLQADTDQLEETAQLVNRQYLTQNHLKDPTMKSITLPSQTVTIKLAPQTGHVFQVRNYGLQLD